jgi:aldehyde dehydrogenase (NAD+)
MNCERFFYIDGQWVQPAEPAYTDVINPATEEPAFQVAMGSSADVDRAVAAARRAFTTFSTTSREERLTLLRGILQAYRKRMDAIAAVLPEEMGATTAMARGQSALGAAHIEETIRVLERFPFSESRGPRAEVRRVPVGVCSLISAWNNPVAQVITKAIPAIAAGCTTVNKPSEIAPVAVGLLTEVMHEAGVPPGVFNLINGTGAAVGERLTSHPDVDMVAFTGSTRSGAAVATSAAGTIKRVHQELGGKSPNIILTDADLEPAVASGVRSCFMLAGQTCGAPSRMFVHSTALERALEIAKRTAESMNVGDPRQPGIEFGPLVNRTQFDAVQRFIESGIASGARLVSGGLGRPDGLQRGYYCRPTVFADVTNVMAIGREEIFGPVLCIFSYEDEEDAIRQANDTTYGLVGYVQSGNLDHGRAVAARIRAGYVSVNYPPLDLSVPHGGFKRSGNGRQWSDYALDEYLEYVAIVT